MNDPNQSKKVLTLCDEALALGRTEREAFLAGLRAADPGLFTAVQQLLQAIEDSGSFMILADDENA